MEKLRGTLVAGLIALLLCTTANDVNAQDSIRVAVGKITIKDTSPKRGASNTDLSDYVVLSMALYDTTFIPFKTNENAKEKQRTYDFKITGKGSIRIGVY